MGCKKKCQNEEYFSYFYLVYPIQTTRDILPVYKLQVLDVPLAFDLRLRYEFAYIMHLIEICYPIFKYFGIQ